MYLPESWTRASRKPSFRKFVDGPVQTIFTVALNFLDKQKPTNAKKLTVFTKFSCNFGKPFLGR